MRKTYAGMRKTSIDNRRLHPKQKMTSGAQAWRNEAKPDWLPSSGHLKKTVVGCRQLRV